MKYTYHEIAKMIDHSLLHPSLTDREMIEGCQLAARYDVASVCIKPYAVKLATQQLGNTEVAVGTVVSFPHGNSLIQIKRLETQKACEEGATEIDMVINIGKAIAGDWQYLADEISTIVQEAHKSNALVKVIFENDFITNSATKVKLCEICEQVGADYVKTSTGYGYNKQPDGHFATLGATEADIRLMRASCSPRVKVKAAGGVRDLDALLRMKELGADRIGASATASILDEYNRRAGR